MSNIYDFNYFTKSDGILAWQNKSLKFGDAMAALCYAYGITWEQLVSEYAECFAVEPNGRGVYQTPGMIYHQIDFIKKNAKRIPQYVLEIGGGRGEVANTLLHLGVKCTSVECSPGAEKWYANTGEHYFGHLHTPAIPLVDKINNVIESLPIEKIDTIIMVESLEHIPEIEFNQVWTEIINRFNGLFIVVNWMDYHPCPIGGFGASPEEHCRVVDDNLYNSWIAQSKKCVFNKGSHLVLEF